jgi:tripartite-type tricarboxylate transporter receptor subunit TctC
MQKILLSIVLWLVCGAALAQYPEKPVRLVVPAAPGGGLDLIARVLAAKMTEIWGRQMVVENRPGANFIVGTDAVAKSAPDGYTLLLTSSGALTVNPVLYSNLPYNPERDLAPVMLATSNPFALLVNAKLPAATLPEFIAYLRANPGKLNHASNSATTILSSELFKQHAKVEYADINYKGGVLAAAATANGETDFCFVDMGSATMHIKEGTRTRFLAVTTAARYKLQPQVPTIAESLPGYSSTAWVVILAPAKTPVDIVNKLNADLKRALADPAIIARAEQIGSEVLASSPEDAVRLLSEDLARWSKLTRERSIKLQ